MKSSNIMGGGGYRGAFKCGRPLWEYAAFTCYWNQWHAQRVRGETEGGGANI